jgi:hypothetical protein
MTVKFTFEYVYNYFKEQNCELLETVYINNRTTMKYICKCGNESSIRFDDFKNMNSRCKKCSGHEVYTFEYVYNYFKEQICKLLETEYINSQTKMRYICKCGNESSIRFDDFKNMNSRCKKCSGHEVYTFEYVYNYFKEQICKLLETEYINSQTKMRYICKCGNESSIRFDDFKNRGSRCKKCSGHEVYTFEYVYNYFKEQNCKLLETEYINSQTKMKYICKCGNESSIHFNSFKDQHSRCINCAHAKSKLSYSFKNYIMPSGKIIRIQGYEYIALDELVKIYKEEEMITERSKIPIFNYILKGQILRYYPDIYIQSQNIIIEVKSTWTYKKNLIKNILKSLAVKKSGYNFEMWIYDYKKNKIII